METNVLCCLASAKPVGIPTPTGSIKGSYQTLSKMKKLIIILLLCSAIISGLHAQCDVGIQVQTNSFDINIKTPQAGSEYSWSTDIGPSGSGTSFSIPRNSTELTIFRDGASNSTTAPPMP
jgi:hypothetical protein